MPSYYQGVRDEYGNRDYARRDAYADRYYGPHDERGVAPPEWDWRLREQEEERWRQQYERRYAYPEREDYRYMPDYGGDRGYALDEYGRGRTGYGLEREWPPEEPPERQTEPPHYGHRVQRSGYGYFREPPPYRREFVGRHGDRPRLEEREHRYREYPPPMRTRRRFR